LERFGNILNWFGPLSKPGVNNKENTGIKFLDKIGELMGCNWFHGDISTTEAENRLFNKELGTFLVRFSTRCPGDYTISKVSQTGSIHHQRFTHDLARDTYVYNEQSFKSVQDLLFGLRVELYLILPCAGSRFLTLFMKEDQVGGYIQ